MADDRDREHFSSNDTLDITRDEKTHIGIGIVRRDAEERGFRVGCQVAVQLIPLGLPNSEPWYRWLYGQATIL